MFNYKQAGFIPLVPAIIVGVIALSGVTFASQTAKPGDALYGLKVATENVRISISPGAKSKANLHLDIAEEKSAEAQELKGDNASADKIAEAVERMQKHQTEALDLAQEAKANGQDVTELIAKLKANLERQQQVLTTVLSKVPEPAKAAIQKAITNSQRGINKAIEMQSNR